MKQATVRLREPLFITAHQAEVAHTARALGREEITVLQLLRSRGDTQLLESSRPRYFTRYHKITTVPRGTLAHQSHGGTAKLQVQFRRPRRELQPALRDSPASTTPLEPSWGVFSSRPEPCFKIHLLCYKQPPGRLQRQHCGLSLAPPHQRAQRSSRAAAAVSQQRTEEKGGSKIQVQYIMGIIRNSLHRECHS